VLTVGQDPLWYEREVGDSREQFLEEAPDRGLASVHPDRDEVVIDVFMLQVGDCVEVAALESVEEAGSYISR
jgi:hypothetical protein